MQATPGACIDALTKALGDEHFMVRQDAAKALGEISARAKDAIPALEKATHDSVVTVQQAARKALETVRA